MHTKRHEEIPSDTIEIFRSLIQKAIRRADLDMTKRAATLLITHDFDWLRNRLAVLTFEECWTYAFHVSYEKDEKIILNHLLKLASAIKNRNAAGLGSLAYILSEGDESVLNGAEDDEQIQFMSAAIKDPRTFWVWAKKGVLNADQKTLTEKAMEAFGKAEQPWDKAFTLAGAYLAVTGEIPVTKYASPVSDKKFPLWIAIDMHTKIGTAAIREAAHRIKFDEQKALWLTFYLEGVTCNEIISSPWWEREKIWRMKSLGLTMKEAQKVWGKLKIPLVEILKDETEKLRKELFTQPI